MADTTIEQAIQESAAGPKRVSGDAGSVEQHSLKDQIEADQYLAKMRAAKKGFGGLKQVLLSPPGGA